jgi:hypothetical protein
MPITTRVSTRTPLLLSIAGLLLVPGAVLAQSPSPTSEAATCVPGEVGKLEHKTGCMDIVLRVASTGGFVPVEFSLTDTPIFTLYGDNTAIFRPQPKDGMFPGPGEPMTPLVRAVMSPDQVDALLTYALGPGALASAAESYFDPRIADAPTTVFTVDAAGVTKQVAVQALGMDDPAAPDAAIRKQLYGLYDLLDSFEDQVAAGNVQSADLYQPAGYRGMLTQVWEGATDPKVAWPWSDVTLEDFVAPEGNVARYAPLTPEQVALVTDVPSGGITNIRLTPPDGSDWFLAIRPLLPEESFLPEGVAV